MPELEGEWEILMREAEELNYAAGVLMSKAREKISAAKALRVAGCAPWPGMPKEQLVNTLNGVDLSGVAIMRDVRP